MLDLVRLHLLLFGVSLKKSRKSGNHTFSMYDNVAVVFSKIGVLVPATYWFQCNVILKIRFASDSLLRQCFSNDSTFPSPCSWRKIRIYIPPYLVGPWTIAFDVFLSCFVACRDISL